MRKYNGFFLLTCLLLSGIGSASCNTKISTNSAKSNEKIPLLFVVRAENASVIETDGGNVLELRNIDPDTLYFSDRPFRISGYLSTDKFVAHWGRADSSFQKTPPNAAMVHASVEIKNGWKQAIAVEMSNPTIMDDGSITFDLKSLNGQLPPGDYDKISIFIDGLPIPALSSFSNDSGSSWSLPLGK